MELFMLHVSTNELLQNLVWSGGGLIAGAGLTAAYAKAKGCEFNLPWQRRQNPR